MKPRVVMVVLELETDISLKDLKTTKYWSGERGIAAGVMTTFNVRQVTATVAQPAKEKKVKE